MTSALLPVKRRRSGRVRTAAGLLLLAALLAPAGACRSVPAAGPAGAELAGGVEYLSRPLPGDMAALYRLRVPSSGGLRLSVLTRGVAGRITISEPFGSALSLTAWSQGQPTLMYDLKQGCRLEIADVSAVLGIGGLPVSRAAGLLGGRLPVLAGDAVRPAGSGTLAVRGAGWTSTVRVAAGPWRVVEVTGPDENGTTGWTLTLDRHTSSVPGLVRGRRPNGDWFELELVRLEWGSENELPPPPDLPDCGAGATP